MPTEIDKVVKNFKYNQGSQYMTFKSGDKIAAYGVGALVAGSLGIKGLAKTGALAAILAFAKKSLVQQFYSHLSFCSESFHQKEKIIS